tara:strand:- start:105 stop:602 length:498 start_codon:yes stop_codon:yes gene_type:complete
MIKSLILYFFITILLTANSFSAGSSSSGGDGGSMKSNYEKAVSYIKKAKKFEEKENLKKATKEYSKAQKLLLKSNKKKPNKADTLNYLGFTTRKLGDFEGGEKYYLQGLSINPSHVGINEYLGELYVATGRHNLAVERLEVLKSCKCKEYDQLKAIIAGEKVSKY